jgi:hypothetical protein
MNSQNYFEFCVDFAEIFMNRRKSKLSMDYAGKVCGQNLACKLSVYHEKSCLKGL